MNNVLKLMGPEVAITSANTVGDSRLIRVVNTGSAAVLNLSYANGTVYANCTVTNTAPIILEKSTTDKVTGANMLAVPVAYRG